MNYVSDLLLRLVVSLQTLTAPAGADADGERGQGMVEYSLILALVAVIAIVMLTTLGKQVNNTFSSIVSSF